MAEIIIGTTTPEVQVVVPPSCLARHCENFSRTLVPHALDAAMREPGTQQVITCTGGSTFGRCRGSVESHVAEGDVLAASANEQAAFAKGAGQIPLSAAVRLIQQ